MESVTKHYLVSGFRDHADLLEIGTMEDFFILNISLVNVQENMENLKITHERTCLASLSVLLLASAMYKNLWNTSFFVVVLVSFLGNSLVTVSNTGICNVKKTWWALFFFWNIYINRRHIGVRNPDMMDVLTPQWRCMGYLKTQSIHRNR